MDKKELQEIRDQGIAFGRQGMYQDALLNLYRAFNGSEAFPDFQVRAALDLGVLYRKLEKYTAAAEMFDIVDDKAEMAGVERFTAALERAIISYKQKDLEKAEENLSQAESILEGNELGNLLVYFLHTRAWVEYEKGNFNEAMQIFEQSLFFVDLFKREILRAVSFYSMGYCCLQMGELENASDYLQQSLAIARRTESERRQAESYSALALVALKSDDLPTAKEYAAESFRISYEHQYRDIIRDLCYQIGRFYHKTGREEIAQVFFEKAVNTDGRLTIDYLKLLDTDRLSSGEGLSDGD